MALETAYLHEGSEPNEAANYALLKRGAFQVHLILDEPPPFARPWTKPGVGYLYLKVKDINEMFEAVKSSGVAITRGLQTESWGARGFNLTDPSGNDIHIEG